MNLNKLNKKFYMKTQVYFNRSRQFYWQGSEKLLVQLQESSLKSMKVLDVGCGNGRFGKWLSQHRQIDYLGLDNNQYLLDKAKESLPGFKFINQDVLKPWQLKEKFELAVVLGLMHHLVEADRLPLLKHSVKYLKPKGILFLSFWQFNKLKESKIVKNLGNNDFILDWKMGTTAERYCHLYDDKEVDQLIKPLGLKILDDYEADKSNRYLILSK